MSTTNNSGQITYDKLLSNYAVSIFSQSPFYIADKLASPVMVNKPTDKFLVQSTKGFFDDVDQIRAEGTGALEIEPLEFSDDDYSVDYYSYKVRNLDFDIAIEEPVIKQEFRKADRLIDIMRMRKEKSVSDLVFTAANYTLSATGTTYPAGTKWNVDGGSTTDPMDDINTYSGVIQSKTAIPQNMLTLTISSYTLNQLKKHPAILNFMSVMVNKNVTTGLLAEYFGVKEVLIGNSYINASQEGVTASTSLMWGKHALLSYIQPAKTMQDPSFAKQFIWNGNGSNKFAKRNGSLGIKKFINEELETSFMEIGMHMTSKLTYANSAFLITDVVN